MSKLRAVLTDRLYLSALGIALVFVVGVAYLFTSVLQQPLTSRPDTVTVTMPRTGGLFEGSGVTYRGVKVGKVTKIVMGEKGVEATISLTSSTRVPEDSVVKVRSLSPVGEQYLDFQPRSEGGPYLGDGSTIAAEAADLPLTLGSTVIAVNKVLEQIDDRKLRSVLVSLSTGLQGTGDDIGRMVDQGDLLLAELDRVFPQTQRLLRNADPALDIGTDNAGNLQRLATSAKSLAAFLRDYDPELRATLRKAPGQITQLRRLVLDAQRTLPDFLSVGVSLTDILSAYDPHLRALLQSYAPGLDTLNQVIRGGQAQLELILDADPRCRYATTRHQPRDPTRHAFQTDGQCSASFSTLQRGAAHAPGPVR